MMIGDCYVGRGSRQRYLGKSLYCNKYKVSEYGRERAISQFAHKLKGDSQSCHADETIKMFCHAYPADSDRENPDGEPPS